VAALWRTPDRLELFDAQKTSAKFAKKTKSDSLTPTGRRGCSAFLSRFEVADISAPSR
jgi:hypothetical protein